MILVRDMIFNKDEIWDDMSLQYIADKIEKLNKTIQIIKLLEVNKLDNI